jgi:hypothetical protein
MNHYPTGTVAAALGLLEVDHSRLLPWPTTDQ